MTDEELRALPKVLPEDAANYLDGEISPQGIRIWARQGNCPFCWAIQMPKRHIYPISREMLIAYKHGTMRIGLQKVTAQRQPQ